MNIDTALILQASELIQQADGLLVAAGAGMGVDSGLPDFRGNQGFWQAYPALGKAQLEFTRVASPATFRRDPALAWGFYGHRLAMYRATQAHEGFAILREWGQRMPHGAAVFTSNVDGQFQQAGFERVYECHGSIHHLQCLQPCCGEIWSAESFAPQVDPETCTLLNPAPRCPHCGAMARPNILMFNDGQWIEERSAQQERALDRWLARLQRPLVIELGAGTAIPSVRHFSQQVVAGGGRLIRINPREYQVGSSRDVGLAAGALEGLRAIAATLSQGD